MPGKNFRLKVVGKNANKKPRRKNTKYEKCYQKILAKEV